jgi:hypothetical protein
LYYIDDFDILYSITQRSISEKVIDNLKQGKKVSGNVRICMETFQELMEPKTFISLSLLNVLAWFCECHGFYFVAIVLIDHLVFRFQHSSQFASRPAV